MVDYLMVVKMTQIWLLNLDIYSIVLLTLFCSCSISLSNTFYLLINYCYWLDNSSLFVVKYLSDFCFIDYNLLFNILIYLFEIFIYLFIYLFV
jgi:hypothetical protein